METVDALELEISTRAGSAAETVEALAVSVSNFGKNVRRYVNNMADFAGALERIADAAKSLSSIKGLGSVLSKISGSGMLEKAGAANVAAAKAAASKIGQDWKHAMFKSQKEYEQMFPSRAAFRGQTPEKWIRTDNNHSRVMDANDVVKSQATALAKTFRDTFGLDRGLRMGDIASRIMSIRAGSGRFEGANQAWITPKAQEELNELAHLITMSAHTRVAGDAIDKMEHLGSQMWLNETDIQNLKSAGYTIRSVNSALRETGYSVTTNRSTSSLERGKYAEALGLNANASITDVVAALIGMGAAQRGALERRHEAFIGDHSFGGNEAQAEDWVREQIMRQILDVGARNEKTETAPDAKAVMEVLNGD